MKKERAQQNRNIRIRSYAQQIYNMTAKTSNVSIIESIGS